MKNIFEEFRDEFSKAVSDWYGKKFKASYISLDDSLWDFPWDEADPQIRVKDLLFDRGVPFLVSDGEDDFNRKDYTSKLFLMSGRKPGEDDDIASKHMYFMIIPTLKQNKDFGYDNIEEVVLKSSIAKQVASLIAKNVGAFDSEIFSNRFRDTIDFAVNVDESTGIFIYADISDRPSIFDEQILAHFPCWYDDDIEKFIKEVCYKTIVEIKQGEDKSSLDKKVKALLNVVEKINFNYYIPRVQKYKRELLDLLIEKLKEHLI